MKPVRPPFYYTGMFLACLAIWCLQQPGKLPLAILAILAVLLAYRWSFSFAHSRWMKGFILAFIYLFSQFILHGGERTVYVAIYNTRVTHPLCTALVLAIVYLWYDRRSTEGFDWLLLMMGLLLTFASASWRVAKYAYFYLGAIGIFVAGTMWRFTQRYSLSQLRLPEFPRRNLLLHLAVSAAIVAASFFVLLKTTHFLDGRVFALINQALLSGHRTRWTGFSDATYLSGGMNVQLSNEIVMLVQAPSALEHLRGNVLVTYKSTRSEGRWFADTRARLLPAHAGEIPPALQARHPALRFVPLLPFQPEQLGWQATFHYQGFYEGRLFLPVGTVLAGSGEPDFETSLYGVIKQKTFSDFPTYILAGRNGERLPALAPLAGHGQAAQEWEELMTANLRVPDSIRSALLPVARQVTAGAGSDLEKARRIEDWFHRHFTYSLQTQPVTPGLDPIVDFVLNRKPAFCSWFASGMTLMLRSLGIPAHIASGWHGMEYNKLAQAWIVREKNAHDWVEVLDRTSREWVTLDPTPGNQLQAITGTDPQGGTLAEQLKDWLNLLVRSVGRFLIYASLGEKFNFLKDFVLALIKSPWAYLAFALVLLANYLLKRRRATGPALPGSSPAAGYQAPEGLRPLADQFFHLLRQRGIVPGPAMTLGEIRQQIEEAEWSGEMRAAAGEIVNHLQSLRFDIMEEGRLQELSRALARFSGSS